MYLSPDDESRVAFHLGYNRGAEVPAGDVARLQEACRRIPDEHWYRQVIDHLNRCDRAWNASEVMRDVADTGVMAPSQLQLISGDANRSVAVSDPLKADTFYREVYLRECDRLAETLYVRNYRRPEQRQLAFERSGATYIQAVAGPADTSVGTRVLEQAGLGWA
ncbi:MAG: hypothetical protein WBM08_05485 [Prochlorococcaceae cyanobacterium]